MNKKMELMSPAGNLKSFAAAIEAGADAVYLGYLKFNARRPADNFDVPVLRKLCTEAHRRGKKVYVTLNIDLKDNELSEAARVVEMLCQIHADALIVKDLGLISLLNRFYKGRIAFHASTQMALTSAAGAKLAGKLGCTRAVLARELTKEEISCVSKNSGIETEVFVEGSMCFSVSGRCLMSSWVGGRSGNRGACTAPCRLAWENAGKKMPYFSMKDMLLVERLDDIAACGADTLKIEGRLKSPGWVSVITSIYRKALDCAGTESDRQQLENYSARETGEGHFFGHSQLVGKNENWANYKKTQTLVEPVLDLASFEPEKKVIVTSSSSKAEIQLFLDEQQETICLKLQPPKKGKVGMLHELAELMEKEKINVVIDHPEFTGAAREIRNAANEVLSKMKLLEKRQGALPDLPDDVKAFVDYTYQPSCRKFKLGNAPDKLILSIEQLPMATLSDFTGLQQLCVCVTPQATTQQLDILSQFSQQYDTIISFPPVIYETEEKAYFPLIQSLRDSGLQQFQADSLSMLEVLSKYKCVAGPWLSVLNRKSAALLYERGCKSVYASIEAEEDVLEALDKTVSGSLEALVFGRLPLFISRVQDDVFCNGARFRDNIGTEIECKQMDGISYFFSTENFSLQGISDMQKEIHFDHLTADLSMQANPLELWKRLQTGVSVKSSQFNFARKLV